MPRPSPPDAATTVRQRLLRLSRHRGIALAAFMVAICATVPFILALPPLYRASATVLIEGSIPGLGL